MTYVVGYSPHKDDGSALKLACQLARSESDQVHAVTVVPRGWGNPLAGDTDREFEQWAAAEGEASADLAMRHLGEQPEVEATASWITGRSVPQALLERATELDASILVVGSGEDTADGQVSLTSKTSRLVHSSDVPIAIAPRGYDCGGGRITRVTVGFRDDDTAWSLLEKVARICRRVNAQLRVVTFVVRPRRMATTTVSHAEDQILQQWVNQVTNAQVEAADFLASQGFDGDDVELLLAEGDSWKEAIQALSWQAGDILVVGSSSTHKMSQVFLGSSASKIVRLSPVPVVVVP